MSLVFQDTFQTFNSSTWRYDLGDGSIYGLPGWGNGEMQASAECNGLQEHAVLAALPPGDATFAAVEALQLKAAVMSVLRRCTCSCKHVLHSNVKTPHTSRSITLSHECSVP
jgi:hypothetical protein